jgi:hypothetical protein
VQLLWKNLVDAFVCNHGNRQNASRPSTGLALCLSFTTSSSPSPSDAASILQHAAQTLGAQQLQVVSWPAGALQLGLASTSLTC